VAFAACAIAAVPLAGCGGDDSSNASSSGSSASGSAATEAAKAKEAIAPFEETPTKITVTQPLPKAPEPGKTFVWLNCEFPQCTVIGNGVKAATEAAGWKYKQLNFSSADPASLASSFKQALNFKPAAVAMSGIPPETGWGTSVIPAYQKAGVPIVTSFFGDTKTDSDTLIASIAPGTTDRVNYGQLIGRWLIADSGGKAHVVLQRVDAFPGLKVFSQTVKDTLEKECSECKVYELKNTISQASGNGIVPTLVPFLKQHPDAKYLVGSSMEYFDNLPSALAAANIKVKVAGQTATQTGYSLLKDGKFGALTTFAPVYSGWLIVDAALRHAAGVDLDPGDEGAMPTQLLTPESDFEIKPSYEPTGFEDQFKTLWKTAG
jgi:ribose transport system substrate-binding protein